MVLSIVLTILGPSCEGSFKSVTLTLALQYVCAEFAAQRMFPLISTLTSSVKQCSIQLCRLICMYVRTYFIEMKLACCSPVTTLPYFVSITSFLLPMIQCTILVSCTCTHYSVHLVSILCLFYPHPHPFPLPLPSPFPSPSPPNSYEA